VKLDFQIPSVDELFNLNETEHRELFREIRQPWDVLLRIEEYLRTNLRHEQNGQVHNQAVIQGDVYIGEGSIIEAGALICGPVRIGRNCRIGHGAILRNNLVVWDDCVLYPNINFGGVLPARQLVKNKNELEVVPREEDGD